MVTFPTSCPGFGRGLDWNAEMNTYCFDIDGTLCEQTSGNYSLAKPWLERIDHVNRLFSQGHIIKIFTARGSKSGLDWRAETENQLREWGLNYHELVIGKPHADFYIDDKAVHPNDFMWT